MRHSRTIIAVALLAVAFAVPATAARAAGPSANPPGMKRLSDERTLSRWAYPNNHARVRSRPTGHARTVAKLHWLTEDNLPEIYLVLASWRDSHKNTWVKIRVPKRPNGVTGWVPRRALRQYTTVRTFLDLNRSSLLLTLYRSGKAVMSAHVGIGSGSNPTPRGRFYVREKFRVAGASVYGPFPGRPSHG
jgi:L,D-transpeptidase catalytic domain